MSTHERSIERKYKRKYTREFHWLTGLWLIWPRWELANPSEGWHGSLGSASSSAAIARICVGGDYWVRAQIHPDGEATPANMLAFGLLGVLREEKPTLYIGPAQVNRGRNPRAEKLIIDRADAREQLRLPNGWWAGLRA